MLWLSCIISNIILASFLAFAAWFVQRWLQLPSVARILWLLVLLKLVTPSFVRVPLVELPGTMACTLGLCSCPQHSGSLTTVSHTLLGTLAAVWATGAIATGWTACRRWSRFRRILAHAVPAPSEFQSLAARLSSELAISCPQILAIPGRLPPLVVPGWRRPRLLLPTALLAQLTASQKSALLMHELVHIKRRDHVARLLELVVGVLYWWLPTAGTVGRQLRACEETSCDAAVVARLPLARRDYARLLLDVIDFASPLSPQAAPQATAMSVADNLEQRLRGILDAKQNTRCTWPAAAVAVGLACAILPCELHYAFVNRGESAATSAAQEGPAADTCWPSGNGKANRISTMCCPS